MRVGIAGFGNVGREVANRLLSGAIPEVELAGVTAAHLARAECHAAMLPQPPQVLSLPELIRRADVIVECATAEAFPEIARAVVGSGKRLVAVSACGVPNCPDVLDLASRYGGSIIIANGAFPGLDIIRSAKEGGINQVKLTSRLRPDSVAREPYVAARHPGLMREGTSATKVFHGTAAEAAEVFPRHFNVAVTLSLAGIGLNSTEVEVWCDADVAGAMHRVDVDAADISVTMISRNIPSANPRTSRIVAPSILAALRALVEPVRVGS